MLWPVLALMVRWVPSIFSTVPRILTGGLGAWATATADTAAISNAADVTLVRIMGSPSGERQSTNVRGAELIPFILAGNAIFREVRNDTPSRTLAGFSFPRLDARANGLTRRHRLRRRARLSGARGEMGRALSARRDDRRSRPYHVAMAVRQDGAAVSHREQGGRRQQYRRRVRRARGPRRLHHAPRQSRQRDQRDALQEPALRFHPGHRAGRRAREDAERDGGHPFLSGQDRGRIHRLLQGESREDQYGVLGKRDLGAFI